VGQNIDIDIRARCFDEAKAKALEIKFTDCTPRLKTITNEEGDEYEADEI
jgi:hypothetical protein